MHAVRLEPWRLYDQSKHRVLTPDGADVPGLECRAIKTADGWLAYVNKLDRKNDKQFKLATGPKLSGIRNLTLQ